MKAAICQPQMGKEALLGLLSAKSEGERAFVFDAAREARYRAFGNKVFLYGFLYLSTHCRNDCAFCQYRRSNSSLERYRKPLGEMQPQCRIVYDSGASRRMGYTCSI